MTDLEIFTLNTLKNNDFHTLLTLVPRQQKDSGREGIQCHPGFTVLPNKSKIPEKI